MDEASRLVPKLQAVHDLNISLSTLDRKIRRGEIEVVREGHRVYVLMNGPEHPSDNELLRLATIRVDELERTVRGLERTAYELERERDEAREATASSEEAHRKLEKAYTKERAAHRRTKRTVRTLGLVALTLLTLLVFSVLVTWRPFT